MHGFELGEIKSAALRLALIEPATANLLVPLLSHIEPWSKIPSSEQSLTHHFKSDDPALNRFAVYYDDVCVGAVSVRYPFLKGPYLELLGLSLDVQGIGIGSRLMQWFENEAPPPARSLWLLCSDFNRSGLEFYEQQGFKRVSIIEDVYADGLKDFLMRKQIANTRA